VSNINNLLTQTAVSNNVNGLRNISPGGGTYVTQSSTVSGAIKITLPSNTAPMIRFTVRVYTYDGLSFDIYCGGHNSSGLWYNTFAYMTTQNRSALNVRFTYGGGNVYVYIGELGSSWSYPQVFITDVQVGYATYTYDLWDDNWSITFDSSTYNNISSTHVVYPPTSSANNTNPAYASIYYDANNTGYYVDPNSRSRLLQIDYGDSGYFLAGGDWGYRHNTPYGWIQFGPANTSHAHIYTDRSNFYFNAQIQLLGGSQINQNDIRSPIFYDSNNTGYYFDGNSNSRLVQITTDVGTAMFIGNQNVTSSSRIIINWHTDADYNYLIGKRAGAWPQPMDISFYTGIRYHAHNAYGGHRFYSTGYDSTYSFSVGDGDNNVRAYGDMRAPIFYDLNDTGYYVDPASTSITNDMRATIFYDRANTGFYLQPSVVSILNDCRASIFYDRDNTGYYVNPAGTTQLAYVLANDWFRAQGSTGFYYQDYGYGQRSAHGEGNSYGNSTTYGTGRNGWTGWGIGSRLCFMSDLPGAGGGGSTTGLHDNNYGWIWRWVNESYFSVDRGYSIFNSSARAPIFYDSNDTSYYLDPGGTSNFATTVTGYMYFQSNRDTSSNSPPLQAYSSSGGAIMSFHRGGVFAINMGLDSDNVFRIGGWSASTNRLQMDMSGNLTMAGNVTAFSDERLKKDWAPIYEGFIERLAAIRAGTYTRIDSGERQAGVSAQAMREILPEVVNEDNEGTFALAYGNAALVAAVELAKELVKIKQELAELRSKFN
jgi:hypothetical protein